VEHLIIKGAREHNLKNIDLTLPRDKLIVVSGLSGVEGAPHLRRDARRHHNSLAGS
jgi:excinuclease UvrABC ATPase subunit